TTGVGERPACEQFPGFSVQRAEAGHVLDEIRRTARGTGNYPPANHQRCAPAPTAHVAAPEHPTVGGINGTDTAQIRGADVEHALIDHRRRLDPRTPEVEPPDLLAGGGVECVQTGTAIADID